MIIKNCIVCKTQFQTPNSLERVQSCSRTCANEVRRQYRHTDDAKKRISTNNAKYWLGKKLSDIARKKIALAQTKFTGINAKHWKGEEVGYGGLHDWIRKTLGTPTKCSRCGKDGLTGRKIHWHNLDGGYSREPKDWVRLCVSCHQLTERLAQYV